MPDVDNPWAAPRTPLEPVAGSGRLSALRRPWRPGRYSGICLAIMGLCYVAGLGHGVMVWLVSSPSGPWSVDVRGIGYAGVFFIIVCAYLIYGVILCLPVGLFGLAAWLRAGRRGDRVPRTPGRG